MSFNKVISPEISEMGRYLTLIRLSRELGEKWTAVTRDPGSIGIISYKNIAILNQTL
jgi:hypothetical protein